MRLTVVCLTLAALMALPTVVATTAAPGSLSVVNPMSLSCCVA